jgi:glutamate 5-kinase
MIINNKKYNNIIIKIGSSLIVEENQIREKWLLNFTKNISQIIKSGDCKVTIVSSGAVALGKLSLNLINKKLSIQEKQACAAIGQIELMNFYKKFFSKHQINIAQILLTASDCNDRDRYLNCKNTINNLINYKIIPIINENDSVAIDEIKIGDNDRLCARVAQMIDADLMILLSDIDGLYDKNPKIYKDANFIKVVENINSDIEKMASGTNSSIGTGGMITKILAAKMVASSNCDTIISSGIENNSLLKIIKTNKKYTIFKNNFTDSKKSKHQSIAKKKWLAGFVNPKGSIIINDEAVAKLKKHKVSILAIGTIAVEGNFSKGEAIFIKDQNNHHIASGISNHASFDIEKILKKSSQQIKNILGNKIKTEIIDTNNIIIL